MVVLTKQYAAWVRKEEKYSLNCSSVCILNLYFFHVWFDFIFNKCECHSVVFTPAKGVQKSFSL